MSKVLTIERATWYRGKGARGSVLLNRYGMKCCLGFDAIACGLRPENILGIARPDEIDTSPGIMPDDYFRARLICADDDDRNAKAIDAVDRAIRDNDDETINEDEREKLIRADLIALGWDDVVFV